LLGNGSEIVRLLVHHSFNQQLSWMQQLLTLRFVSTGVIVEVGGTTMVWNPVRLNSLKIVFNCRCLIPSLALFVIVFSRPSMASVFAREVAIAVTRPVTTLH
jgi:hypothetical protein